jgi:hypothetical protein
VVGVIAVELENFSFVLQHREITIGTMDLHGEDIAQKGYSSRDIGYQ